MFTFEAGPVYYETANSIADIVINQGGTDSGKTYAIMQRLFTIATGPAPEEDPIITIIGESIPNLKRGAYRIAKNIILKNPGLLRYIKSTNETDRTIYFKTGWIMEFQSYADEQSAKQGKRQYSFFNEANGLAYLIFWQVAKRTRKQVFIDYNPSEPFWAHEKLIGSTKYSNDLSASVELIISDHRHNPFLTDHDHFRTENILDPELWKVYARGQTGNVSGIIYPDWTRIPDELFPKDAEIFGGLDFGYTNDPTAGVKIAVRGNNAWMHEVCYEPGLSATATKEAFYSVGFNEETEIYCEHDRDEIKDLRDVGINALFARKGPNSIKPGIKKVKEFKVFYTASSVNIHRERQKYLFEKDKLTGMSTNTPIDQFNHLMDAIRYGLYTKYHRG